LEPPNLAAKKGDLHTVLSLSRIACHAAAGPVAALFRCGLAVLSRHWSQLIRLRATVTPCLWLHPCPCICSTPPRPSQARQRLVLGSALSLPLLWPQLFSASGPQRPRRNPTRGFNAGPPVRVLLVESAGFTRD